VRGEGAALSVRVSGLMNNKAALALLLFVMLSCALPAGAGPLPPLSGGFRFAVSEDKDVESSATQGRGPAGQTAEPEAGKEGHEQVGEGEEIGKELPLWSAVPFLGILLSIALFPLLAPHFWHRHFPKISAAWALIFAVPFIIVYRGQATHEILHIYLLDYFPFVILLWSLFTASGGIVVRGKLRGTPVMNILFLTIGTVLASWIGTTGASMLMIRPVLRANAGRKKKVHIVVFFIFLVSNIGGSLTPLGDPPLFLGFLHGVPFFWTFRIFPEMAFVSVILLLLFFLFDSFWYRREKLQGEVKEGPVEPLKVDGLRNLIFLAGIVGSVLMSGMWHIGNVTVLGVHMEIQNILRDAIMIVMGLLSIFTTPKEFREANEFTWFPIKEVAYLFAGIFMTIVPALAMLRAGTEGSLAFIMEAVKDPAHYFWVTGVLSSFLDNAPTYLTFFNSALGEFFPGVPAGEAVHLLIKHKEIFLKAISTGAVFMGANTYIGNAPNFMVRSIAEESGIRMPSFFGYILKYSLPILIPLFAVTTVAFFI